jgi:membrane protein YqaA with SNARE-associated domain
MKVELKSGLVIILPEVRRFRVLALAGACYLSAVILTAFPDILLIPLLPLDDTLPSFALASASVAARVEAAFLVLIGSCCNCLADASQKANLTKSETYKYAIHCNDFHCLDIV